MRIFSSETDVCKQPRLSVCMQNRSNAKNISILNPLEAVIHKSKRNAAGKSEKIVHPWSRFSKSDACHPVFILFEKVKKNITIEGPAHQTENPSRFNRKKQLSAAFSNYPAT